MDLEEMFRGFYINYLKRRVLVWDRGNSAEKGGKFDEVTWQLTDRRV